jgi:hypothetical protein
MSAWYIYPGLGFPLGCLIGMILRYLFCRKKNQENEAQLPAGQPVSASSGLQLAPPQLPNSGPALATLEDGLPSYSAAAAADTTKSAFSYTNWNEGKV